MLPRHLNEIVGHGRVQEAGFLTCFTAVRASAGTPRACCDREWVDWARTASAGEQFVCTGFCSNREQTSELKQFRGQYDQAPRGLHGPLGLLVSLTRRRLFAVKPDDTSAHQWLPDFMSEE